MNDQKKTPIKRKRFFNVTPEILKEIEQLSGRGLTKDQIAGYYGFSRSTLRNYENNNPELAMAFDKGKSKGISHVAGRLMHQINEGSTQATIFYLKTQAGWKSTEESEDDQENKTNNLTINVNDPNEAAKIYQEIMRGDK